MKKDFNSTKKQKPGRRPFNDGKKPATAGPAKERTRSAPRVERGEGERPAPFAGARRERSVPAGFGGGYRQPPRGDREGGERRPPRRDFGDRPARAPRGDGPSRGFGDRPQRAPRGDGEGRAPRAGGPGRGFGDRPQRAPRGDGEGRGPREGGFGERPSRPFGERPNRSFGDRPTRGPREDSRPARMDREETPRYNRLDGGEGRPMRKPRDAYSEPMSYRDEVSGTELPFRPHVEKGEIYYHGRNACEAIFKARPKDIIRVYVKKELSAEFKDLLNFCATHRLAYHIVGDNDLERLTDTKHHDGICVLALEKPFLNEKDFYREIGGGRTLVLFLDGVGNPHNLGAILRTASHFGVKYVAGQEDELPRISPSANRVSEGGSEHVTLVRVEEPESFFDRLKKQGFQVYAFENSEKAIPLFDVTLNEKAVFVMGAEVEGLSGLAKSSADVLVKIPGTGLVESLNVSVAAALAMAEFRRQATAPRNVRIVKKG